MSCCVCFFSFLLSFFFLSFSFFLSLCLLGFSLVCLPLFFACFCLLWWVEFASVGAWETARAGKLCGKRQVGFRARSAGQDVFICVQWPKHEKLAVCDAEVLLFGWEAVHPPGVQRSFGACTTMFLVLNIVHALESSPLDLAMVVVAHSSCIATCVFFDLAHLAVVRVVGCERALDCRRSRIRSARRPARGSLTSLCSASVRLRTTLCSRARRS